MVTVSDPGGTPVVVYNNDGTTIDTIIAAGTNAGTATVIARYSTRTVVMVNSGGIGNEGVRLPANAQVGDTVEIYWLTNSGPTGFTYVDAGSSINETPAASLGTVRAIYRKTTSTDWFTA